MESYKKSMFFEGEVDGYDCMSHHFNYVSLLDGTLLYLSEEVKTLFSVKRKEFMN
jgi:hypothetical protein